ncbi:DUF3068 domain-containing protein [Trujillonella humicola]|uniref:DUF3068 domain-containing protein n=1 Tax=Trujillonella humicola TaxID=3383699 RepID=UPI003906BC8E
MGARVVGLTLVGLGGCALSVAVLVGTWLAAEPPVLALDESYRTEAVGQVTYLDPASLAVRTGNEVVVSVRVQGDAASGDAGDATAVWIAESSTEDADGTLVATTTTVACLDRRSVEARGCAAASVDGSPVQLSGLVLAFPPGTPARDLDVWDGTTGQALPARYAGTERFRGLEVLRFEQEVPEQVVRTVTVPGAITGGGAGFLSAEVVHRNSRTLLVEPVSGVVVRTEESPVTVLRGLDGAAGPVLLSGTLTTSEESAADAVGRAQEVLDRQRLLGAVVPWTAGGSGAALTVLGVLLVVRSRPAAAAQVEDEPARVPVPTA